MCMKKLSAEKMILINLQLFDLSQFSTNSCSGQLLTTACLVKSTPPRAFRVSF